MLKKAKWISPDKAGVGVSRIAATVVPQRLDAVWHYARLAALFWKEDAEHVHQLRVCTRRAAAAMDTLVELIPPRRAKNVAKTLKLLRRSAGEARDLDVLAIRLQAETSGECRELASVLDTIAKHRSAAQKPVKRAYQRLLRNNFPKQCQELEKRIRWRSDRREPTYAQAAQVFLLRVVNDYFAAAGADLQATKNLHALRIEGKRLRYAFEILSGAFDRCVRDEVYPCIESLQHDLGAISDHDSARRALRRWAKISKHKRARKKLKAIASAERIALDLRKAEFSNRWTSKRLEEIEDVFRGAINTF